MRYVCKTYAWRVYSMWVCVWCVEVCFHVTGVEYTCAFCVVCVLCIQVCTVSVMCILV